ncbi:MAG: DUF58 domain-containing protein [Acidobacteriota bacterium]
MSVADSGSFRMWPGHGLVRWLLLWLLVAVVATAWPAVQPLFVGYGALLLAAIALSGLSLARRPLPTVRRTVAPSLALGEWTEVSLRLEAPEEGGAALEAFDHYPTESEQRGLPLEATLGAGEVHEHAYRLRPRQRGSFEFGAVEVWMRSPGDLLRRRAFLGEPQPVRVVPNFRPALQRGLAGIDRQLARLGVHLQRRRGDGLEFQNLRDYRYGDSMRLVDWKATARRSKLISREYQDERNQQLMLLIDCGRRMHAREGDLTHFDHVLDACLLLAYVAGKQGDATGFQTFAGEPRSLPPVHGARALPRLLDGLFDLRTTQQSPDYAAAASRLIEQQQRRALVLVITNLRDEDDEEILSAVRTLSRRHVVLVASVRELTLRRLGDQPVRGFDSALEVAATRLYLEGRGRTHEALRSEGAFVLDVEPPELPASLVQNYLEIKRAGRL